MGRGGECANGSRHGRVGDARRAIAVDGAKEGQCWDADTSPNRLAQAQPSSANAQGEFHIFVMCDTFPSLFICMT